ncbi:MAG: PHP domain-containing protein [Gemmatimonadetes bacterium]|jgi:hypothetical protein|nr:PHP domain-containing protein [Gemmatimonadota bacterium]MBT5060534.1 PHP domain-containing protein [Gemmatimonadota bacterium]MBT5142496.1 PHP domain-containing protein [Gemmatimonadota bacterium]MBT5586426.1 PHP domain-containing protein [Gemmatimonadota bacterium]MBT5961207.1 PHP domain-containing protein [Gemmatimonadota bacterium]
MRCLVRPRVWLLVSVLLTLTCVARVQADAFSAMEMEDPELVLDASIHVHTQYSTGRSALADVVDDARRLGIDVVVITDDDLLEVSYGIAPWRNLLRVTRSYRSLLGSDTLDEYLTEIRRLDALHDDIIVIDGVESAPFYHWDVDVFNQRATVGGWNKHLLAVGLDNADAYRHLPILGGDGNWLPGRRWLLLWPIAGLLWAALLGSNRKRLRSVVIIICCLFLGDSLVSGLRLPRFQPYDAAVESAVFNAYFDAVNQSGGLSFWAHPEAASTIPPLQVFGGVATVASQTRPHAQDLLETSGYTGFAALYADHITATEPDQQWDQTLSAYLRGERQRPVWGTGEIDYHENVTGNRLHDILTVLRVKARSRGGVLQALRDGGSYAVRGGDDRLRLTRFQIQSAGGAVAKSGQVLTTDQEARVLVDLDKVNGVRERVEVRLIRGDRDQAQIVARLEGVTPLQMAHIDALQNGETGYYRVMARTGTSTLTSNPIFVTNTTRPTGQ